MWIHEVKQIYHKIFGLRGHQLLSLRILNNMCFNKCEIHTIIVSFNVYVDHNSSNGLGKRGGGGVGEGPEIVINIKKAVLIDCTSQNNKNLD